MKNQKTWFITGASRGLGLVITKAVLAAGDQVIAAVRKNPGELSDQLNNTNLFVVPLDVTDENQAKEAVAMGLLKFKKIDILLNNAGFGILSAIEEATNAEVRNNYETNVFGTLNVIRAVLPTLREQRSGHIINMSSVGGLTGSAGWGLYNSTKFAVEGLTEALSKELAPLGIHATAVEPGYFRTDFLDASSLHTIGNIIPDYDETVGKMRSRAVEVNKKQPGDPQKLAEAVILIAHSENPPVHLPLGKDSLNSYRTKSASFEKDISTWYEVITGTDHDDVQ